MLFSESANSKKILLTTASPFLGPLPPLLGQADSQGGVFWRFMNIEIEMYRRKKKFLTGSLAVILTLFLWVLWLMKIIFLEDAIKVLVEILE